MRLITSVKVSGLPSEAIEWVGQTDDGTFVVICRDPLLIPKRERGKRKRHFTMRINASTFGKLEELADQHSRSVSELIDLAIAKYVDSSPTKVLIGRRDEDLKVARTLPI